ncbi:hypothetical protein BJ508DRAFT_327910 [Ascobolus immersus RN42]|uniref:Integrase core domain-containing protein n=1 Tax=Ascobolus immersus RN42 TaxID=1160509 RepID=A0A3N4I6X7_ASCIM|nr:hypothetical protein BJ508DRAFT_327910 [Ascobolus immersus RN42]
MEEVKTIIESEKYNGPIASLRTYRDQFKRWNFPTKRQPSYTQNPQVVELVSSLYRKNYTSKKILRVLKIRHNINMSIHQLKRLRLHPNIRLLLGTAKSREAEALAEQQAEEHVRSTLESGEGLLYGRGYHIVNLRRKGIFVSGGRMRRVLRTVDPEGVRARRLQEKRKRGQFMIEGPNKVWSIDGHDKLNKFGFGIYAAIDAYSHVFRNLFVDLQRNNFFSRESEIDIIAMRYIYMPVLRQQVYDFMETWNTHRIRNQRKRAHYLHSGTPEELYTLPKTGKDYGVTPDPILLERFQEHLGEYDLDQYLPAEMMELCKSILQEQPERFPDSLIGLDDNHEEAYKYLRSRLYELHESEEVNLLVLPRPISPESWLREGGLAFLEEEEFLEVTATIDAGPNPDLHHFEETEPETIIQSENEESEEEFQFYDGEHQLDSETDGRETLDGLDLDIPFLHQANDAYWNDHPFLEEDEGELAEDES